jgi:hypothetical protein
MTLIEAAAERLVSTHLGRFLLLLIAAPIPAKSAAPAAKLSDADNSPRLLAAPSAAPTLMPMAVVSGGAV